MLETIFHAVVLRGGEYIETKGTVFAASLCPLRETNLCVKQFCSLFIFHCLPVSRKQRQI